MDHNDVWWTLHPPFFLLVQHCSLMNPMVSFSVSFLLLLLRGKGRGGGNENCLLFVLPRIRRMMNQDLSVSVLYCWCSSVATFMMNSFGYIHLWSSLSIDRSALKKKEGGRSGSEGCTPPNFYKKKKKIQKRVQPGCRCRMRQGTLSSNDDSRHASFLVFFIHPT